MLEILTLEFRSHLLSVSSEVPDKIDSLYKCLECANHTYCCIFDWVFTYGCVPRLTMVDERWLDTTKFNRHIRLVGICRQSRILHLLVVLV